MQLVIDYPTLSQALRKLSKSKEGRDEDSHHHHHCGFSTMMHGSGHPDLDRLMKDQPPMAFEFELLRVESPGSYKQDAWAMTDKEKLELVPKLKEEGNHLYRSGNSRQAAEKYHEAISYLEQLSIKEKPQCDEWNELQKKKVPLLLNYAQCKLLMKEYAEVIRHTSQVLEFDPSNVKALFRRGKSHSASWDQEEAERDFKRVIELDPSLRKAVEKELKGLHERVQEKEREEKERLKGKLF